MDDARATPSAKVTVVHAPACHYCDDALQVLTDLSSTWSLDIRVVDLESTEGAHLVAQHRPAMNPLVLLDGEYFSSGRLPRKKLLKVLAARAAEAPRHSSLRGA